jgi:hypothetical protein
MRDYLKSTPHFFRRIKCAMGALLLLLLGLAWLVPAPLQEQANPALPPNPAKSAWFLLWVQELVSYSTLMIYPVLLLALAFLALPWLPGVPPAKRASWLPNRQWPVTLATMATVTVIVALTLIAMLLRGKNWELVSPF